MHDLLLGADPEIFIFNEKTKQFVSAHDVFPGTKKKPYRIGPGAVQVDGVAYEFNITPAKTTREFCRKVRSMLLIGEQMLKETKGLDYVLRPIPTADFEVEYFNNLPFKARLLGCEPDFSAYTGKQNPKPETKEPFRTGSGHIHFGFMGDEVGDVDDPTFRSYCDELVRHLDIGLYIPSLLYDNDQKRRSLYGAPGAYRPKFYGLEYRVLSNAWLKKPDLVQWVADAARICYECFDAGYKFFEDKQLNSLIASDKLTREIALDVHEELLFQYGLPEVPEA